MHGKNSFAEVSKYLATCRSVNNFVDYQNNYVGISSMINNVAKSSDILATSLSVIHNYFNGSTKLLSDLYLAEHLLQ